MIPDEAWKLVPKDLLSEVEPWIPRFAEPAKPD